LLLSAAALLDGPPAEARVLDDFNDNTKTGWTDFTFVPGYGLPVETGGEFRFELPGVGQAIRRAIFTASQKTSELLELKEGRTLELRVDVLQAGGKDSFAVLAFLPAAIGGSPNSPGTLAGYGFAKSTTDVLLTKGISRYFVADDGPTAELKNDNITLVLRLAVRDGNVVITGRALDKDNNNAVLWERTIVDTPAADVMADGEDSPAAPFITTGYFTLYCYADYDPGAPEEPYRVFYDNAEVFVTDAAPIDDFNDNTKTGWTDFTFVPGYGLPTETSGQFRFELPGIAQTIKQAIFTASQKTARVLELAEGEQLQLSVDIVESGGKDSFAVLGFLPLEINGTPNSPGTLAGYGFAKSTTDVLLTKGINRYFVAEATALKQNNTRLELTLTARNGTVEIRGRVLDLDDNNAVLWERTVFDTPAADVMADGEDSPAAPFITTGYFTLLCYADYDPGAPEEPYFVYYDNANVATPPQAANTPPLLTEVQPAEFANFLPATTEISFKVDDDKPLAEDKISVTLNGAPPATPPTFNRLDAQGRSYRVTVSGALTANTDYAARLSVEDADGATTSRTIYFDTFAPDSLVIEVEDYNFGAGQFFDNPTPIAEDTGPVNGSYSWQTGIAETDFHDTRATPNFQNTRYRPEDPVRMQHSLDFVRAKFTAAGGAEANVFDYDVGDIAAGEWLNYTRNFPPGAYVVYLRQAVVNMDSGESVLEEVTSDRSQPDQTTRVLGSFLGARTGFQYRNFPLTDGTGQNRIVLNLSGETTLRLRQVTANAPDGGRFQNYLVFVPTEAAGVQRATVSSLFPAANSTVRSVMPTVQVVIQNRDTSVKTDTIKLELNGVEVTPTITPTATGAEVTYAIDPLPPSGQNNIARISFRDSDDESLSSEWSFVIAYAQLDPANRRPGPGQERGFKVRFVQATFDVRPLANDLQRAEDQLAQNSTIPKAADVTEKVQVINMAQVEGDVTGYFPNDQLVPGLDEATNGTDDFAVEVNAWLDLPAGKHRFRIRTDDGYKLSSGRSPNDKEPILAFHNGGPANETVDFVVTQAGLYPFRFVWYERGGNAFAEWATEDFANPETRVLINDPNSPTAIRAFTQVPPAATVQLFSSATVTGPYEPDTSATIDPNTKRITLPAPSGTRFYRLNAGAALSIRSVQLAGGNLELTYE
jgi:hypothetical protein